MAKLKTDFPRASNTISAIIHRVHCQSISELIKTIYEGNGAGRDRGAGVPAGWRPAIIPILAIPVSLIGTFAVMGGSVLDQ